MIVGVLHETLIASVDATIRVTQHDCGAPDCKEVHVGFTAGALDEDRWTPLGLLATSSDAFLALDDIDRDGLVTELGMTHGMTHAVALAIALFGRPWEVVTEQWFPLFRASERIGPDAAIAMTTQTTAELRRLADVALHGELASIVPALEAIGNYIANASGGRTISGYVDG